MSPMLNVRPQGSFGRWLDARFEGVMRFVLGVSIEATQKTHRWNNHHLKEEQIAHLFQEWMVNHKGDPNARKLPTITILAGAQAHMTRFGGVAEVSCSCSVRLRYEFLVHRMAMGRRRWSFPSS